ncbi:MAG: hypothetical protein U0800_17370 [Isosphaeraceae bacterium]
MPRRSVAALASRLLIVAIFLGSIGLPGCGGDPQPVLDIPKESVQPGGPPPSAKAKGPAIKSIKHLKGSTPESK